MTGAGVTINHALLLGELADFDIEAAQRAIDSAFERGDDDPYLSRADVDVIMSTLTNVVGFLTEALTADGDAADTESGRRLAGYDLIEVGPDGHLMAVSRHVPLADLRHNLDELVAFLRTARQQGLRVRVQ